jgi:hypothetical protein
VQLRECHHYGFWISDPASQPQVFQDVPRQVKGNLFWQLEKTISVCTCLYYFDRFCTFKLCFKCNYLILFKQFMTKGYLRGVETKSTRISARIELLTICNSEFNSHVIDDFSRKFYDSTVSPIKNKYCAYLIITMFHFRFDCPTGKISKSYLQNLNTTCATLVATMLQTCTPCRWMRLFPSTFQSNYCTLFSSLFSTSYFRRTCHIVQKTSRLHCQTLQNDPLRHSLRKHVYNRVWCCTIDMSTDWWLSMVIRLYCLYLKQTSDANCCRIHCSCRSLESTQIKSQWQIQNTLIVSLSLYKISCRSCTLDLNILNHSDVG